MQLRRDKDVFALLLIAVLSTAPLFTAVANEYRLTPTKEDMVWLLPDHAPAPVDNLNFSVRRPSLAAKGARDGMLLSGLAIDDNDPLARRDQGLEFLDVTAQTQLTVTTSGSTDTWVITNKGNSVIDTHLLVILTGLPSGVTVNAPEQTRNQALPGGKASGEPVGEPVYRLFLPNGVLRPGTSTSVSIVRSGGSNNSYKLKLLSGQGKA